MPRQRDKKKVLISSAVENEKLPCFNEAEQPIRFGAAHYSWKIIKRLYAEGLKRSARFDVAEIVRPEIYQSKIAQDTLGIGSGDIHVAVKPIEHLRPLPGVKNIYICGWEFPEFSTSSFEATPFLNQIAVLRRADEVWCWSDFTSNNLRGYGINNAITLPPPLTPPAAIDRSSLFEIQALPLDSINYTDTSKFRPLGAVLDEYAESRIFVAVLNPFDRRKQLKSMLSAFQLALQKNPDLLLLIKLTIDNVATTLINIQQIIKELYEISTQCDRIVFVGQELTDVQMATFLALGDFYLCTSSTEGLNLPLLEAMWQGVVPVATKNSAMLDYISSANSVGVECSREKTGTCFHALSGQLETTHFPPLMPSLVESLITASRLEREEYERLSMQAKKDVREKYGTESFIHKLSEIGL